MDALLLCQAPAFVGSVNHKRWIEVEARFCVRLPCLLGDFFVFVSQNVLSFKCGSSDDDPCVLVADVGMVLYFSRNNQPGGKPRPTAVHTSTTVLLQCAYRIHLLFIVSCSVLGMSSVAWQHASYVLAWLTRAAVVSPWSLSALERNKTGEQKEADRRRKGNLPVLADAVR